MWQQVEQLPIKARWQNVLLVSRSLVETFENNIFSDSLVLLLESEGPIYGIGRVTTSFIFPCKNVKASGDSLYDETVFLACVSAKIISTWLVIFERSAGNVWKLFSLSELPRICTLIFRNLPCSKKSQLHAWKTPLF